MKLGTKEHYELMEVFERDYRGLRLDRESKDLWPRGIVYQSGETNSLFLAFRKGYSYCEAVNRDDIEPLSAQSAQPQAGEWGPHSPYMRIVTMFDQDETAASFLSEDGDGGFAGGVYRMAREIDRLRALASRQPVNPAQVTDEMVDAAKRIRDLAMKQMVMARIPECGDFGAIAQDADWVFNSLTAAIGAGGQAVEALESGTIRICPRRDGPCPHGIGCLYNVGMDCDMEASSADLAYQKQAALSQPHPADERVVATHRHKNRGTEYVLLGIGKIQSEDWFEVGTPVDRVDMREVAIYRSVDDGSLWVRPREEFEDGRFEVIAQEGRKNG